MARDEMDAGCVELLMDFFLSVFGDMSRRNNPYLTERNLFLPSLKKPFERYTLSNLR